jgi:RHS repeat-associated protein
MADSERENDTIPSRQGLLGSDSYDPNPRVGRVLLTHGPGIDQPLSVIRMGYREWEEGQLLWQPFAVIPLWDTQGRAPYMLFSNGARSLAPSFAPSGTRKLQTFWRLGRDAYGPANNAVVLPVKGTEPVWMGGVIADQQDASGLLYRRNRYYDPQTGRFTQEDPIGLAGGLNLYGFANGDPVGYSDPYGLSAEENNEAECLPCLAARLAQGLRALQASRAAAVAARAAAAGAAASSAQLARNMEASGIVRQAGTAAHHIVAGGARAAEPARRVLTRFKVEINAAENGVFLPDRAASAAPGMYHRTLHTQRYYEGVNNALRDVRTRQEALEVLGDIRDQLQSGTFPR